MINVTAPKKNDISTRSPFLRLEAGLLTGMLFTNGPHGFYFLRTEGKAFDY